MTTFTKANGMSEPVTASTSESAPAAASRSPLPAGLEDYQSIYWQVRSRLDSATSAGTLLGVVGAGRGVGTSTVAANLAACFAHFDHGPVLLVDANVQRPQLRGPRRPAGQHLAGVLAGECSLDLAACPTEFSNLHALAAGDKRSKSVLVDPEVLEMLVQQLRETYQTVVFDLPVPDQLDSMVPLASELDGSLLVVRSGVSNQNDVQAALKTLERRGVPVSGSVLSRVRRQVPGWLDRLL